MKSLKSCLVALALTLGAALPAAEELNLFGWSEYIPQDVLDGLQVNRAGKHDTSACCLTAWSTGQALGRGPQLAATPSMASRRTTMRAYSREVSSTESALRRVTRPATACPLR